MASSQYLAQALQAMAQQPTQQQPSYGPSLGQMQQMAKQRQAWEAANPGQSYFQHSLGQMGQGVANAPGNIAAVPGNIASGFQKFVAGLPGLGGG